MIEIKTTGSSTRDNVRQIQTQIGGDLTERWGEYTLIVNNENATGKIQFISYDWGVTLLEYNITFHKDVVFESNYSEFNPIRFYYCLEGQCAHRFKNQPESDIKTIEQFQSVIIANTDETASLGYFSKGVKLAINVIQITRRKFLKKRLNGVEELNKKLYKVFMDTDHEKRFSYFGSYNLKLANKISALRKVRHNNGMIRIMQIEGLVYEILAMHIAQHEKESKSSLPTTSLLRRELKIIRDMANKIAQNVSKDYTLEQLSRASGLSQAKLQEGFKLLYARTVTEYIRHVRLEAARDYLSKSDMNISQVVYSIGFSSRSYFSKIFKNKFGISPSEFQNNVKRPLSLEVGS
ncbi:AraC family transcriptional regulator [Maribacter sp. PR1]|uniref:AraC family transcriptional regulator n=1 Tax=Maribacter cobaltidurans TaxID=1178778 RepID=A0ABU7IUW9_9FLAO|nr:MULTISPECIES: AraC family transcriptional regulator [Maribacter]MDC6389026.1 AraC family transcriptional regulator [Maribacter sp. PR1]MEE1976413.1 AraC family transcriptional regulator [Maribacter cobaltidurans]